MDNPDSTKTCTGCGEMKPLQYFGRYNGKRRSGKPYRGVKTRCKECTRIAQKAYRDKGGARDREMEYRRRPEIKARLKAQKVRREYGISEDQYIEMLAGQDNKCAACGGQSHDGILRVDHCHTTEEVRGLLCNNCNVALGFLQDDPERIQGLLDYVAEWKKNHPGKSAKSLVR